ncbi:MAG: DNA translocase FtsK 4TM domain-containing protein [Anaerolineales bacterium]|nr:DNA translocase FtsK 4TM domain-containing protein [Anaerolineales bacterium]
MKEKKPKKSSSKKEVPEDRAAPETRLLLDTLMDSMGDLIAVALIALAIIVLLGLFGLTRGGLIDPLVGFLRKGLGYGAFLAPILLGIPVYFSIRKRRGDWVQVPWLRVVSLEITLFATLALMSTFSGMGLAEAEAGSGGGIVGWGLARLLGDIFGGFGRVLVLSLIFLTSLFLGVGVFLKRMIDRFVPSAIGSTPSLIERGDLAETEAPKAQQDPKKPGKTQSVRRLPREFRKNFQVGQTPDEKPRQPSRRDPRLPTLDILVHEKTGAVTSREINLAAGLIEKTLTDFGLPARVVNFRTGPSVTQFAVEPGYVEHMGADGEVHRQKVRVSQISALANDLALALTSPRLRIEAPVPGQAYVGIEVPNRKPSMVRLRPILETEAFQSISSPLTLALGRDVAGAAVATDLTAMPHLLIAGTTGSGKSVSIASIAVCLAMNNTPEDMRLVMIDPKMVELIRFNGLPHLLGKVETELERIVGVLRWCTVEMDRRYRLLESTKARDIEMYNRKTRRQKDVERLSRIVILIDELADLMMMAPDQTEHTLVRLAQMARATGIHLVVATQRPSTDILTGLIKANFPARISFAVASGIDSRVILDTHGAETLLGKGDMLFLSPEASAPIRLQGVYVTDGEIERLKAYWCEELGDETPEAEEGPWEELLHRQAALGDHDEILEQAIALVKERDQASASLLQRGLRIGYPRAARLMDQLEELGVVGRPQAGGRTREVLIGADEDPLAPTDPDEEKEDSS